MGFNPETHFKVRNLTRDPITLKAADGSFCMIHPGSGDLPVEHKFNWDLPEKHKISLTGIPHPEKSVMTSDHPKISTNRGHSTNLEGKLSPPARSIRELVNATVAKINYNRKNNVKPIISNKTGTTYVGRAGTRSARAVSKALGLKVGAETESAKAALAAMEKTGSNKPVSHPPVSHTPAGQHPSTPEKSS